MNSAAPPKQAQITFSWRYEGAHVMLWALGVFDALGRPANLCDVPRLATTMRDMGASGLRAQGDPLDAADLGSGHIDFQSQ